MRLKYLIIIFLFYLMTDSAWSQNETFFSTDFENDNGELKATDCWEWGPALYGPDSAHSDLLCWGTDIDSTYPGDMLAYLETPEIDLSSAANARLTFWHWYEFEADQDVFMDGGNLSISANGAPFEVLIPFRGYPGQAR